MPTFAAHYSLMEIIEKTSELDAYLQNKRAENLTIGFVPTMGALHQGHISLVERAKQENSIVVVSIFVNPTQFNEQSDFVNYPSTPAADAEKAGKAGCDVLFTPSVNDIYPEGKPRMLDINFGSLESVMEGSFRPGHFSGVATVVYRLFNAVKPHNAYFGEKDFQQLAIIRELVRQKSIPVKVIGCPTVREDDGLAMSSRNVRLSPDERQVALHLSRVLFRAREEASLLPLDRVAENARKALTGIPSLSLEYFEIVDADTLQPVAEREGQNDLRACVAARVGETRLIDNIRI